MEIGLDQVGPQDAEVVAELGAKWTKTSCSDFDNPTQELSDCLKQTCDMAAGMGLKLIVDLRPSAARHVRLKELVVSPNDAETDEIYTALAEGAAFMERECGNRVAAWEFWGEFDCPHVGGVYPGQRNVYPPLLACVYDAIKGVNPQAQVWNGGYGVNYQRHFADSIIEHAPHKTDALNWHHYNVSHLGKPDQYGKPSALESVEERAAYTAGLYREMFLGVRAAMEEGGMASVPFSAAEWGMPIVPDSLVWGARAVGMFSFAFDDGSVFGLGDAEAVVYFNEWLKVFDEVGFKVLNLHRLQDWDAANPHCDPDHTFWGSYCGLKFADGTPKQVWEAAKTWAHR